MPSHGSRGALRGLLACWMVMISIPSLYADDLPALESEEVQQLTAEAEPDEPVAAFQATEVAQGEEAAQPQIPPSDEVPAGPAQVAPQGVPSHEADPDFGSDVGLKPLTAVRIGITPTRGDLPPDHAGPRFANETTDLTWPAVHRPWLTKAYCWDAPWSRNYPLFFEDANLERYGWSYGCLQPAVSAAKFYATIPALPYKMALGPYCEPQWTLGYYRPGNCVPYQFHYLPLDAKAAAVQGAAIAGGIYLVP